MSNRNVSIELYRVLLMLGIVGLHCHQILKPFGRGLDNVFATCVVGFVFISGWFGIKFSWRKVARILSIGLYCGMVTAILHCALLSGFTLENFVHIYWFNVKCFWFLWAYIALMMLAPLVDKLFVDGKVRLATIAPLAFLVFGWSYLTMFPKIGEFVPSVTGFAPTGVLTLLAIYIVARFARMLDLDSKLKIWQIFLIGLIGFVGSWFGFYHYNSPFALAIAFASFVFIKQINIPAWIGKICGVLGPSMFSIYLLHTTVVGFRMIERMDAYCQGGGVKCYVWSIIVVFLVCIILDLPRRWIDGKIK